MTDILFRMVAPSLVMMTSPSGWHTCLCRQAMRQECTAPAMSSEKETFLRILLSLLLPLGPQTALFALSAVKVRWLMQLTILSMPLGPKLVRTASATAFAALMLLILTSLFLASPLLQQNPFNLESRY